MKRQLEEKATGVESPAKLAKTAASEDAISLPDLSQPQLLVEAESKLDSGNRGENKAGPTDSKKEMLLKKDPLPDPLSTLHTAATLEEIQIAAAALDPAHRKYCFSEVTHWKNSLVNESTLFVPLFHHRNYNFRETVSTLEKGKLYLSGIPPAQDLQTLKALGIRGVIDVSNEYYSPHDDPSIQLLRFKIDDQDDLAERMIKLCYAAVEFINSIHKEEGEGGGGGAVLIHCQFGISRSTTVALFYLMHHQKMTLRDAWWKVKRARAIVFPNDGFMRALIKCEEKLFDGRSTITMEEYRAWEVNGIRAYFRQNPYGFLESENGYWRPDYWRYW